MDAISNFTSANEIALFANAVDDFLAEKIDDEQFTAIRLQHGIYGQRQNGMHMVRIKIPGGVLSTQGLRAIGEALDCYSENPFASITTRQDVQLHFVPIKNAAKVMELLATAGLTTREACGNTVRNITACPLAGVCPSEHVDVRPLVNQAASRFLRHPLTQHLPRKFKMSFSGCESDCAQGSFHDLAVVAVNSNGRHGFKILAGGGLGHKARTAVEIEPFVTEANLLPSIEAVLAVHHRYSDRRKRAKSRIKFLVERFGTDGFIEKYHEEKKRTAQVYAKTPGTPIRWFTSNGKLIDAEPGAPRRVVVQRQADKRSVPIAVPLGDITAKQLNGLADLMDRTGLSEIRTTQDQNLLLVNVDPTAVEEITAELTRLQLALPREGDNVAACPGTWTCRLGITSARAMAEQLTDKTDGLRIRVSGCHNGCAQPHVADIGLHGEGKRIHGKLVPHYRLHLGGSGLGGGSFALKGPEIPVVRVQEAVLRLKSAYRQRTVLSSSFREWVWEQPSDFFEKTLGDLTQIDASDLPVVARDLGESSDFRVTQFGGGECAGVSAESIAANFAELEHEKNYREVFFRQRMYTEAMDCLSHQVALVEKILPSLSVSGVGSVKMQQSVVELENRLRPCRDILSRERTDSDETVFGRLKNEIDAIIDVCSRLNSPSNPEVGDTAAKISILDLTADVAPLVFLKLKKHLREQHSNESLQVRVANDTPLQFLKSGLEKDGYSLEAFAVSGQQGVCVNIFPVERRNGSSAAPIVNMKEEIQL